VAPLGVGASLAIRAMARSLLVGQNGVPGVNEADAWDVRIGWHPGQVGVAAGLPFMARVSPGLTPTGWRLAVTSVCHSGHSAWDAAALRYLRCLYRMPDTEVDLTGIRIHCGSLGADQACRVLNARAMTVGSDIYFRAGCHAPGTARGLWLLAHEVAHVVQQRRGPVTANCLRPGLAVSPPDSTEEHEAVAAADAALVGLPFVFAPPAPSAGACWAEAGTRIVQRYMAWEHLLLGNLEPEQFAATVADAHGQRSAAGIAVLADQCALADALGRGSPTCA
jgi:hypothetical protein